MGKQKWTAAILMIIATCFAHAESDTNEAPGLKLSGYYKNLLAKSNTLIGPAQPYTLDLNRLRLQLQGELSKHVSIDVQYDNEILLGNYLHTPQFQMQKDVPSGQYWSGDSNYFENANVYARHRFYRASMTVNHGDTDIKFGRQRITWGTGRFWSPLDLLNPIAATQLEREERPGVDAVMVERKFSPLSRLSVVYAPQHDHSNDSMAAQFHGNANAIDYSIVLGKFQQDHTVGFDIATQLGGAGIRSELTYTRPGVVDAYRRGLIGIDYAFANTLTLSAEYYYNGHGTADATRYDFNALFVGRVQSLARNYAGLYAGYEITPLLKWNNYAVVNLDDRSRYFSPSIVYSVRENLDWTVGMQSFGGNSGSEYGRMPNLYYTQLQWFF
jgi:hypothetical protein